MNKEVQRRVFRLCGGPLLRETGDFLVRASQSGDVYTLVLNVKKHRLPNDRRLVKPVKRPWWLLRHAAVKYDESGKLGSGNFCDVFRGKVTIDNNEVDVAIKICHPPTQDISAAELLEARTSMIKEAKLMAEYKDANFYGVACDRPPLMILMELCAGGSMDNHLRNRGKNISATEKLIYLYEGVIKVADFGLSVILEQGHTMCRTIIKEAPISCAIHVDCFRWFAPECCYKEPSFSKKTDVWAFGSVMFEVFSNGSKPFLDVKDQAIIKAIRRAEMPDPPSETPAEATNLLKKIWVLNPDERPSFNGIGKHLRGLIQLLPQIEPGDMVVNQLKGVKRTVKLNDEIFQTTGDDSSQPTSAERVRYFRTEHGWELPSGRANNSEPIYYPAKRKVAEETGINAERLALIALREELQMVDPDHFFPNHREEFITYDGNEMDKSLTGFEPNYWELEANFERVESLKNFPAKIATHYNNLTNH
ncbi:protein tyrosine kinase [Ancylostoma ceylanicum]|uniref:Protein tyrosine kinase n=1 Tax=Ancylostoma ceylanicum TaxID=53326 RepID=A0A0D6M1D6_9BILA|nr:protein tyrosine kinase [Ancylostoma ceylanicum]